MLQTNPFITIRVDGLHRSSLNLNTGSGEDRQTLLIDDIRLIKWVCQLKSRVTYDDALKITRELFGISELQAHEMIAMGVQNQILVEEVSQNLDINNGRVWEEFGWRDALDFHLAVRDLQFNPDREDYLSAMTAYLKASEVGLDEPPLGPYKEKYSGAEYIDLPTVSDGVMRSTLREALHARTPFMPYSKIAVTWEQFSELMQQVYGIQSETNGLLGTFYRRTSPSGGARHPIETYIVINDVENIPPGLYHYSPKHHRLEIMRQDNLREIAGTLCFEKTGIKTASAVVFLTVRWSRHMWKYRYARSYRMVLFDVGHLVQTHVLTGCAIGIRSYLCPSVHDSECLQFLNLEEDCDEGVVFAIGIGPM